MKKGRAVLVVGLLALGFAQPLGDRGEHVLRDAWDALQKG